MAYGFWVQQDMLDPIVRLETGLSAYTIGVAYQITEQPQLALQWLQIAASYLVRTEHMLQHSLLLLEIYWQANDYQRATPIMEQLAKNTADQLDYFDSLDENLLRSSYDREQQSAQFVLQQLLNRAEVSKNPALLERMEAILANHLYLVRQQPTNPAG
ncbi:MAG: hypothetical protein HC821_04105 [Lewinella sp.]|nr:hypothetical protein [Lewinella sp.]